MDVFSKKVVFLSFIFIFIFSFFGVNMASANTCGTAISIACGDVVNGNTAGEATSGLGTCGTSAGTGGVMWYTFTGDGNPYTFEVTAGSYDTKIWIYSGSCASLVCVAGDDDGGTGTLSLVSFGTTIGETYYVIVGGYNANEGTYTLAASATPCVVPSQMVYSASTITQEIGDIGNCQTSVVMGYIQVNMTGGLNPINIEQISLNTAGTTDLGDILAINIYNTGSDPVFSNSNLFGSAPAGGAVLVSGSPSQVLLEGVNYFWIEYVLNPTITVGNQLHISSSSLIINSLSETTVSAGTIGYTEAVLCEDGPGGIESGLQVWLKAEVGTTGDNPVTIWRNQGPNTALTQVNSTVGTVIQSGENYNYNSGIRMAGGVNYVSGVFSADVANRSSVISGNEITMFTVYSDGHFDLAMSFHARPPDGAGQSSDQWNAFAFRHNGGLGSLYSNGSGILYNTATNRSTNIIGMKGEAGGTGMNSFNGMYNSGNVGSFTSFSSDFQLAIGYWPGFANNNVTSESIIFDSNLSDIEFHKVESYLAIKYGVTLGVNGTSIDYNSSTNSVVWSQSSNSGFAFDIAGIMRDDYSFFSQLKSHSVEGSSFGVFNDILSIANGANFASPSAFADDGSSLLWGHDNNPLINTGVTVNYTTDNIVPEVIQTIFQRKWKSQETPKVGVVTLEFDLSSVIGVGGVVGANDLANVRLLVDEDGDYSTGATSIAPLSFNNATGIVYFNHDFSVATANLMDPSNGYFFTIGSTNINATPLPVELTEYNIENIDCSNYITWTTASEVNSAFFIIERSLDMNSWEFVGKVDAAGNSINELNYSYRDNEFGQNGSWYYRMSQIDFNGVSEFIGIVNVSSFCEYNVNPIAYPNPMMSELYIETPRNGVINVSDLNGRVLMQEQLSEGFNSINVDRLASGSYMVSIQLDNGKVFIDQFIKQ